MRHVREPGGIGEILLRPERVIQYGAGDCDCIARAVAAMAAHVGLPAAVMAIWTGPESAHVVCAVGGAWYGPGVASDGAVMAGELLPLRWVVDPAQPRLVPLDEPTYFGGRLFAVSEA